MIINITIYKNVKLVITPLEWFIWPVVKRDWSNIYRNEYIKIPLYEGVNPRAQTQEVKYRTQTNVCVSLLLFQLHFPVWYTDKVISSIYPSKYDWRSDPDHAKKYKALCETEYFC